MNNVYEKPSMRKIPLRSNLNIAETCWGNHGVEKAKYYDTAGAGYLEFYIAPGSCAIDGGQLVVNYYDSKTDMDPDPLLTTDPKYIELYQKLLAGSNAGEAQNFKGINSMFPDNPGGMS